MTMILLKNGKKLELRRLVEGDFDSFQEYITGLSKETIFTNQYPGQPLRNREATLKRWALDSFVSFGVFDGNRLLGNGSITIGQPDHPWASGTADFNAGVLKEIEGQGVASMIMEEIIGWAKDRSVKRIEGSVRAKNLRGIALYLKFGFEIEGRKRHTAFIGGEWHDEYIIGKLL